MRRRELEAENDLLRSVLLRIRAEANDVLENLDADEDVEDDEEEDDSDD
jgi:hypothetical protein